MEDLFTLHKIKILIFYKPNLMNLLVYNLEVLYIFNTVINLT